MRKVLVLVFACSLFVPANAQFNVDSVKQLLPRTPEPIAHLKLLRQLSRADDTATMRTYAYATIRYADSLLAHGHAGEFDVLTQKGGGLWNVGTQYYRRGMTDSSEVWFSKAAALWKSIGDTERTAFASSYLASILVFHGRTSEAVALLKETLAAHEAMRDSVEILQDLSSLGSSYQNLGDYPRALDYDLRALAMPNLEALGDGGALLLNRIGTIYVDQEQVDAALPYFRRSVEAGKGSPYPAAACTALGNMASIEMDRKHYPEALELCKEQLALVAGGDYAYEKLSAYTTMGTIYQRMGDLGQAVINGQRAVALAGDGNSAPDLAAMAYTGLARTWLAKGRHDRALALALRAKALCDANEIPTNRKQDVIGLLSDIYGKTGPPEKAFQYYKEFVALGDSIHSAAIRKQLVLVEMRKQEVADSLRAAEARQVQEGVHQQAMGTETGRKRLFMYGGLAVLVVAGGLWWRLRHTRRAKRSVEHERDRSDTLLHNILPSDVAQELKNTGAAQARDIDGVSILFTDFKGFTQLSEQLTAQELVAEINTCFKAFDGIIGGHGVEKIKTIGDAYMAAGGLPVPTADSARNTVLAALEMQSFMGRYTAERVAQGKPAFTMRVGIHTGPVVAGIVGVKKFAYDVWGDTVNIASRMESSGGVGRVNISESTYALVKGVPGLSFIARGRVQAKGKGEMDMYYVEGVG